MKTETKRWRKAFPLAAATILAAFVAGVPARADDMGGASDAKGSGTGVLSTSARHAKLERWMSERDVMDGATLRAFRRYELELLPIRNLYFKAAYLELLAAVDIKEGLVTYREELLPEWAVPDFKKLQATLEPFNLHIQSTIGRVEAWTTGKDFIEVMKSFDRSNAVKYTFPQEVTDPNFSQSQLRECEDGDEYCFTAQQEH